MPTDYDDEDLQLVASGVRDACKTFDDEYWSRCDREHEFPWEFYRRMADGGWLGIAIPEEYGGGGRASPRRRSCSRRSRRAARR